jgi:type I restriction enzyme S subunit
MNDELPQGWAAARIAEIAITASGGTPSTARKDYWQNGDVPWINSGALKDRVISAPSTFITKLGLENSSAKLFPRKTVVIALTGATTGRVGLLDLETSTNQSVTGIFPSPAFVPEYVFFYLRWTRDAVLERALGSAQPHINKHIVDDLEIPLAPLAEQRRIVAKLEKLLGKVDTCLQRLTTIPVLLKRFRQSVLAAAGSGRLTAGWRAENPNLPTNVELSPTADSENEWPPGWRVASLNEVAEKVQDGNYGALYPKADEWIDSGVAFLIPAAISADGKVNLDKVRFISPERNADLKKAQLADGDVIFPNRGSRDAQRYGFEPFAISIPKTLLPANINPQLTLVRPRAEVLMSGFLRLALNAEFFLSQVREATGGSALAFINLTETKRLRIPIPPLAEQQEIVRRVGSLFASADPIEARYAKATGHVEKLTQSILAKAFRGKLVPQDPNDEPATELLARVRAERQTRLRQQKQEKPYRKAIMNKLSSDVVKEAIRKLPKKHFTFADIMSVVRADYDPLKDVIFQLLAEPKPSFKQVFDTKLKEMRFQRIKA